jgi:uncharacterized protein involved in exopolysaccharide biosynthesis
MWQAGERQHFLRIIMTDLSLDRETPYEDQEVSLLAFASVFLRWRRLILALVALGAGIGLLSALLTSRVYTSGAVFFPQISEGSVSGLAAAASQFGLRLPTTGGAWGPPVYVELLKSRALLEPIARDSVVVAEQGGKRIPVVELLKVKGRSAALRLERGVRALGRLVKAREAKALGAVEMTVTTKWPSVSLGVAQRLVRGVNQFNLETRKSQATAERQFVQTQAAEAEGALRAAEDRLQRFLQSNRVISPASEVGFQHDRLQRDVALRQQLYTTLLQNREEAKIREVRDTPVITVLEEPRLPVAADPRGSVRKSLLGALVGGVIGVLAAFLMHALVGARRSPTEEAQEFFNLVEQATPRFLKRVRR